MFQLYSHHQAYLQSLVELYMLNAYAVWVPSSEATDLHMKVKKHEPISKLKTSNRSMLSPGESHIAACGRQSISDHVAK
jgi:hypothetical protein